MFYPTCVDSFVPRRLPSWSLNFPEAGAVTPRRQASMAENAEAGGCSESPPDSESEDACEVANASLPPCVEEPEKSSAPSPELCERVRALEEELRLCRAELCRIQRQLSNSERLHRSTESLNQELQRQVEELNREIHERNETRETRTDQEVQTDDYSTWPQSDYCYSSDANYYETTTNSYDVAEQEDENTGSRPADTLEPSVTDPTVHLEETSGLSLGEDLAASFVESIQDEEGKSLAESLRATAEAALSQTGFTYDETSGMYYDHSTGFYYDSESQLYYDSSTGIYYYCDAENGRYVFHSQVDLQSFTNQNVQPVKDQKSKKKRKELLSNVTDETMDTKEAKMAISASIAHDGTCSSETQEYVSEKKKAKLSWYNVGCNDRESSSSSVDSEPEEGEILNSDNEKAPSDEDLSSDDSVATDSSDIEEQIWPPCIRVIVVRSPVLEKGSLFIITAVKNATIGREKDMGHTIRIPEIGVSKFHAEVYFDRDLHSYVLVDQGSQNGTVINGNPILQPKQVSEPCVLQHGDEVKFGETVLSFHVHSGNDTCDGCEPGQVRAHLRLNHKEESSGPVLSGKEEKELLRRQGLKKIRLKYGLQSADYEENAAVNNKKYIDRAEKRRQVVGSEGTFQREDAPASVHVEINDNNKGRKMLEMMGWKKGDGLGKTNDGIRDPIQPQLRQKKAGLGAHNASSIEAIQIKTQNQKAWEKARERYAKTFQENKQTSDAKKHPSWIKGSVQ